MPTAAIALAPGAPSLFGHRLDGVDGALDAPPARSSPVSSMPSPRRVISARSTTASSVRRALRSATWNLIEFVPQSITA